MGLKTNGSLLGLQATTLSGGSLAVSQRAITRPTHDAVKRHMAFPGFSAIPHGYSLSGIALAFVAGGLAGNFTGSTSVVPELGAVANMACDLTGTVTLAGLAAAGRGMQVVVNGSATITADLSALARMSVAVEIGSPPKPIDIAQQILDSETVDGLSVRNALKLILANAAGDMTITGTTYRFKSQSGSIDRIVATVDSSGRNVTSTNTG